jgi:hypothetical protein
MPLAHEPPPWLEALALLSAIISVLSAIAVAADVAIGRRQPMWIMDLVWPITSLYFGPVGLWAYWTMGRPQAKAQEEEHGDHHGPEKPFWQTVFVATSHCGAGCTLGDSIAEVSIFALGFVWFGSKLATAYALDFTLAYLFGVLFQFFTIAPMRNLGVGQGLWAAIKADTFSLLAFEVGMFGFMALNRLVFFERPPEPNSITYWFLMQLAMIVGFLTSYPANWALVRSGLKEKM